MKAKVSIIVPNYNHDKYLKQRLDSIFNQSYTNFEVILLDDASTDNSREILSEFAKKANVSHCVFNKTNSGNTFLQWQKGLELAQGDFIWIAESDDFCEPNFLETVLQPCIEDKEVALSYCQSHRVDSSGEIIGNWITHTQGFKKNVFENLLLMDGNTFIASYLLKKNVIPNASAVLINKSYLQHILPLVMKPFMKYNADWFYYTQLICNAKIAFNPKSLNYFRQHENSVIAKADGETGLINLYTMELKMKHLMFRFLKSKGINNYSEIKTTFKAHINNLRYKRAQIYIENARYLKAVFSVFPRILLLKRVIKASLLNNVKK